MAKFGSPSFSVFLVDGYNVLAAKVKNVTRKVENALEPSHGLGDSWTETTPVGLRTATLTQDGAFFDHATNSIHDAMKSQAGVNRIVVVGSEGNLVGAHFMGFEGAYTQGYEVLPSLGALTKANALYQISGVAEEGRIIQPLATKTADWNTKTLGTPVDYTTDPAQRVIPITSNSMANPTVVTTPVPHGLTTLDLVLISGNVGSSPSINLYATVTVLSPTTFSIPYNTSAGSGGTGGSFVKANNQTGGVGYLEVTAVSGFTNFVGKLRDSSDDTTYADLITFTDKVVAPFAERVTVPGTVDRYISFDGNVTGTGSITVFAGFRRN